MSFITNRKTQEGPHNPRLLLSPQSPYLLFNIVFLGKSDSSTKSLQMLR